jgi:hypothetical protein
LNGCSKENERTRLKDELINFELVVCKALTELMKHLYHFNFSKEIIKFLLKFALRKNDNIRMIIADFVTFFMSNQNPSTCKAAHNEDQYKLYILEHFGKLFRAQKFVRIFPDEIFKALTSLYVDDLNTVTDKEKQLDSIDKKIIAFRDKKKRGKLSRAQNKELDELEREKKRRNEKRKGKGLDDRSLQKELKSELDKSEAVLNPIRIKKLVMSHC